MDPRGFLGVLARDCLVGLGGLGGGEAEDTVAGEDFLAVEPALRDFEGIAQVHKGAAGGGFDRGVEVVDFADDSRGIDVGDRKRDEGTTHPKAERSGLAEDKEHSGALGQVGPPHQPGDALVGFVGDLRLDGVGPDLQPDGWQGRLRFGLVSCLFVSVFVCLNAVLIFHIAIQFLVCNKTVSYASVFD